MTFAHQQLELGYEVSEKCIPEELGPMVKESIGVFKDYHNLQSVYIIGSVALGEWQRGVSDLDLIGVTVDDVDSAAEAERKRVLWALGRTTSAITFIDNVTISTVDIRSRNTDPIIEGHLFKLATTGICVWGEPNDFQCFLPSVEDVAFSRTARAAALMDKYRSGNLIEPFRDDPRLLTRSCAKAAMRVLSSVTIMRGAPFHASPYRTAEAVDRFAPEAVAIKERAIAIIDDPIHRAEEAMMVVDDAVVLFGKLFPRRNEQTAPKSVLKYFARTTA